jgi:predicted nucleic acid-binding Zn ribbon protein
MSPQYQFACDECKVRWEVKLSFTEHEEKKNKMVCECGKPAYQTVSKPNFRMMGEGWFGKCSDAIEHPYAITQRELDGNLDLEKRVEDIANNYQDKDE